MFYIHCLSALLPANVLSRRNCGNDSQTYTTYTITIVRAKELISIQTISLQVTLVTRMHGGWMPLGYLSPFLPLPIQPKKITDLWPKHIGYCLCTFDYRESL